MKALPIMGALIVLIYVNSIKAEIHEMNWEPVWEQHDAEMNGEPASLNQQTYQPNWKSLDTRPLPQWYDLKQKYDRVME